MPSFVTNDGPRTPNAQQTLWTGVLTSATVYSDALGTLSTTLGGTSDIYPLVASTNIQYDPSGYRILLPRMTFVQVADGGSTLGACTFHSASDTWAGGEPYRVGFTDLLRVVFEPAVTLALPGEKYALGLAIDVSFGYPSIGPTVVTMDNNMLVGFAATPFFNNQTEAAYYGATLLPAAPTVTATLRVGGGGAGSREFSRGTTIATGASNAGVTRGVGGSCYVDYTFTATDVGMTDTLVLTTDGPAASAVGMPFSHAFMAIGDTVDVRVQISAVQGADLTTTSTSTTTTSTTTTSTTPRAPSAGDLSVTVNGVTTTRALSSANVSNTNVLQFFWYALGGSIAVSTTVGRVALESVIYEGSGYSLTAGAPTLVSTGSPNAQLLSSNYPSSPLTLSIQLYNSYEELVTLSC